MGLTAELLDSPEAVEPTVAEWDALAVEAQRPYSAPAWLLAWWRHAAPGHPLLRVVIVRDEERIVGVAPLFAYRWRGLWAYSLLGTHTTWRIEPVAAAGRGAEVARTICEALVEADPYPDLIHLEGVRAESPWPELLRRNWPGRAAWRYDRPATPAPTVGLGAADVDAWLKSKSSNFRQQMRRMRRKLEKEGAVFRMAQTPEEVERDLVEFERLHLSRWDWRGGSMSLTPGSDLMLRDAGRALVGSGRFRLVSIELDGRVINSQLHIAAGGEVSYWNGGFDAQYGAFKPSFVGLLYAIGDAFERGDERFDLGPGAQDYKYRLADGEDMLERITLIPPGPRHALARAAWAPYQVRYGITNRMTPEQKKRLREQVEEARRRIRPAAPGPPLIVMQPSNGGLALTRALARRGVEVEVMATPSDPHTARTRLADGRVMPSFAEGRDEWLAALEARSHQGAAVVLAGADEATQFLISERDRLPRNLRTFEALDGVHEALMDKTGSYEIAAAAGVRAPWTAVVRSAEDLERVVGEAPYPNVLKPVLSHVWRPILGQERVLLAHTPDELRAHGRRALGAGLDTIVSEYVPGGDDCVEEAILVRAADGSFPMQFGCAKIRQSPHGFGAASLCVSAELRESLDLARTLLSHAGFVGVAGIETKRHAETGDYYFIEANVRLPTQFGLGDAAGVEASWRTYATLAGLPLPPQPPQRDGVKLIFPELDIKELRAHLRGERGDDRPDDLAGWAESWSGTRELGVLDPRDPGPALELARRSLRRRWKAATRSS